MADKRRCNTCHRNKATTCFLVDGAVCRTCRNESGLLRCPRCRKYRPARLFLPKRGRGARLCTSCRKNPKIRCKVCGQNRLKTDFWAGERRCKACTKEHRNQRYAANPETWKRNARAWYHHNQARVRDAHLRRDFGITLVDYERMLKAQNNVCAICGQPRKQRMLAVDHCHRTGRIRGLLCGPCNINCGWLENNWKQVHKYLKQES